MNRRWTLAGILVGILIDVCAFAQTATKPAFEVASVKLNPNCDAGGRTGGKSTPGRITMECADLRDLILTAYGIYGNGADPTSGSFRMQVTGGPSWMDTTRYDIVAQPTGAPSKSEMYGPMLQSLLEDRFALKVHRETKQGPIYNLTVAKTGSKLRPAPDGVCTASKTCEKSKVTPGRDLVTLDITGATIANLCAQLGLVMDREVVDKTGLAGRYDIHLEVAASDLHPKSVAGRTTDETSTDDDPGPSITTALQQQLGLKLENGKGPVQVLVVDHIERPKEN